MMMEAVAGKCIPEADEDAFLGEECKGEATDWRCVCCCSCAGTTVQGYGRPVETPYCRTRTWKTPLRALVLVGPTRLEWNPSRSCGAAPLCTASDVFVRLSNEDSERSLTALEYNFREPAAWSTRRPPAADMLACRLCTQRTVLDVRYPGCSHSGDDGSL